MIPTWVSVLLGVFLGAAVGLWFAAVLISSRRRDDRERDLFHFTTDYMTFKSGMVDEPRRRHDD